MNMTLIVVIIIIILIIAAAWYYGYIGKSEGFDARNLARPIIPGAPRTFSA